MDIYKGVYLLAVLLNLTLMPRDPAADWKLDQYAVNTAVFLLNLGAWWLFRSGSQPAYVVERLLSLGRMAMCCAIGSIMLAFAAGYSPIAEVLWLPLMNWIGRPHTTYGFPMLWAVCFGVLALEILYFRSIGQTHLKNEARQTPLVADRPHGA
ncbi:MAG: hypothetical protein IVW54_18990 [Candidatus Binataceae bacterium]|nr:hypothetical protein [Candidatus Binataceae bacterium]